MLEQRVRPARFGSSFDSVAQTLSDGFRALYCKSDQTIFIPTITNVSEAKANLSKLLEQVEAGEQIIIGRNGKPVAVLSAYRNEVMPRQPGMGHCKGKVVISDDFDDLPDEIMRAFNGDE